MEKMLFASMHAVYRMESRYDKESLSGGEKYSSVFSEKWHINARIDKKRDLFIFVLYRSDTLLDGEPPEKLMDRIMLEAGYSYYPVQLLASPRLGIMDVLNFSDIKEKWEKCTQDMLERMPSPELERYIRFSEKNMEDSRKFIAALYHNAFYKLYFRDIFRPTTNDEARLIRWENFPEREMNQSYLYQVKPAVENQVSLPGEIMKIVPEHSGICNSTYETGALGEIRQIATHIETEWEGNRYIKDLLLEAETIKAEKAIVRKIIIDE